MLLLLQLPDGAASLFVCSIGGSMNFVVTFSVDYSDLVCESHMLQRSLLTTSTCSLCHFVWVGLKLDATCSLNL